MSLDLKKLAPGWWGAIAGAIAAGATLFPNARILGGLGGGVAMFMLANKLTGACCDGCADAASRSPVAQDSAAVAATAQPDAPCTGCNQDAAAVVVPTEPSSTTTESLFDPSAFLAKFAGAVHA